MYLGVENHSVILQLICYTMTVGVIFIMTYLALLVFSFFLMEVGQAVVKRFSVFHSFRIGPAQTSAKSTDDRAHPPDAVAEARLGGGAT